MDGRRMQVVGPQLAAFDALPVGVAVISPAGAVVFANRAFASMIGQRVPALIGRPIRGLLTDGEGRPWTTEAGRCSPEQSDARLHLASGGTLPVDLRCASTQLDGDPLEVVVVSDATRRHRAEATTRERAHVWRTLIRHVNLAIVGLDGDGHVTLANPYLCRLVGMAEHDVLGADWFATFLVPEDVAHIRDVFDAVHSSGSRPIERGRLRARDGRIRLIEWFNVQVREAEGGPAGTLSVGVDVTAQTRSADALRATRDVLQSLLAETHSTDVLLRVARVARQLAVADSAALVMAPVAGAHPLLVARDDDGEAIAQWPTLTGRDIDALTVHGVHVVDRATRSRVAARWPGSSTAGPTLAVPFGVNRLLLVARRDPAAVFADEDIAAVAAFAGSVAPALSTAQAVEEGRRLAVIADRERIARDLHDTVIQRLFALGMSLMARTGEDAGWAADETIEHAVGEMDDIIATIRSTIFELEHPEAPVLRTRLAEVVDHMAVPLDGQPDLTMLGPIDTVVSREIAEHLVAVLQEALANAAKHAEASRVTVRVVADETSLELRVADDGTGLVDRRPPTDVAGFGLQHMAERAAALGGALALEDSDLGGLELVWYVPLDGQDTAATS